MLRNLFGLKLFGAKPKPPSIPLAYRNPASSPSSTITDDADSASTLSNGASGVGASGVMDVTDVNFEQMVIQHAGLVVVDFWADWCQPCEIMSAYTAWLARDGGGRLLVVALDVDENPATPERYQVMGLPTLLFLRDGVEVDRQVGLLSYEALQAKMESLLSAPPRG